MRQTTPRFLQDLTDDELLDRAFEPKFIHRRTPLEVELLWRLAEAHHIIEQAHGEQRRRSPGRCNSADAAVIARRRSADLTTVSPPCG